MAIQGVKRPAPGEEPPKTGVSPLSAALVILLTLTCVGLWAKWEYAPTLEFCDACHGTGSLSCGAKDCVNGRVRCEGHCLKKDDPGWQHLDVAGHSPDELWMRFDNPDGGWSAWTQGHLGEAIELEGGAYVNKGKCPLCNGTQRMPCPVCHGQKHCEECDGKGWIKHLF